jgi:hypothetical protein
MGRMTCRVFLAWLVLTCLIELRCESWDNLLSFFPAAAVETEAAPTDVEPECGPPVWHRSPGRVSQRWKDTSALTAVSPWVRVAWETSPCTFSGPASSTGLFWLTLWADTLQVLRC